MRPFLVAMAVSIFLIFMGCSGGGSSPLSPHTSGDDITSLHGRYDLAMAAMPDGGHVLWGYWQGTFDLASKQVDVVRLRQAEFHANLAGVLNNIPLGLSYQVKSFNMIKGTASVDVTLTHPYPNSDFRGFDTRGIFMGPGPTLNSTNDPSIIYPAPDGCRLLNADGYTRWWNAPEFTTSGTFGYDDNNIIPGFLIPTTTLNPYKYFADTLGPDDPVVPYVNMTNRGTFSTDLNPPKLTRNYTIQFPKIGGQSQYVFHYAVDVNWAAPKGNSPTPKPIDDYPINANCREAYHINVDTTGTTAWYKSDSERGGDIKLALEVFDWQAPGNPFGIEDEIESIWIESKTLFGPIYAGQLDADPGSDPTSGIFHFTIPDVTPTGLDNQEILITIRSNEPNSYAPPLNGPAYPTAAVLSAYTIINIPIKTVEPDDITVLTPNGGEVWGIDSMQLVTWDWVGEISPVNIDLSIDGGVNYNIPLAAYLPNTGKFTVQSVGNYPTTQARIRVSDPGNGEVYDVSNETFTIRPYILVDAPNGNELLMAKTSSVITWAASDTIKDVAILISTNSGLDYAAAITYSAPNTGSYIFYNIPESYIGSHNRIKIIDTADTSIFDESDEDFTILPKLEDQIIVGLPNGGEEWIAGTYEYIKWAGDPNIPIVVIKLSQDSGETWPVTINDNVPNADGKYNWGPIPQANVGSNCRIGVFAANNPNVFDKSDEDFTIAEPGIEVVTPDTGEIWQEGNPAEITWKASNVITSLDILLSLDSGATYPIPIVYDTPNDGTFQWDVDDPALYQTTQARVRIHDHNNPGLYFDESPDFTILHRNLTLTHPVGGEQWRIGFPHTIQWLWTGNIPLVDIRMSIDGGATYDNYITQNSPNIGSFDIAFFDFPWLTDHTQWGSTIIVAKIKIEATGDPSLYSESTNVFIIPITLGILDDKNTAATGDDDDDGLMNSIENMLSMTSDDFDSDRDGMYDFKELFSETGYNNYDLIPNLDKDNLIAPLDTDDNNDGVHDGELVDSDKDGVPNYLEYYGFTYNWLTGKFLKWDDEDVMEDFTVPYYKTDPLQPSTDQDPYSDGMEVSGVKMDQSVLKPGNSPMIPAMPNIVIRLMGYKVTINADIMDTEGHSESQGSSWTRETSQSNSTTNEINWEAGVEVKAKFGLLAAGGGAEVTGHFNLGGSHSTTTTTGTSESTSESAGTEMNWSKTTSTNPTSAAAVKLYLKAYNTGTACASNIVPTITLKVGQHQVATFKPGSAQINILPPGGTYPTGVNDYWEVDSIDTGGGVIPIYLTLDELKAFETGAPVSIVMAQMSADVAAMDEYGYWQYVGKWGEYMARIDSVCSHLYLDPGDGNVLSYMVYADDDPSAPKVTMRDAFLWSGGYEDVNGLGQDTIFMPYRLPNGTWDEMDLMGCKWYLDHYTTQSIPGGLQSDPPTDFNLMDVELSPGSYIVGKVPPLPPLDKPIIHWVSYDVDNNLVLANVTDYYRVKDVWLKAYWYPSNFMMTYDESLGCYKTTVPVSFQHEPGLDMIYATNVLDIDAIPMALYHIPGQPPPENPKPSIGTTYVSVGETQTNLTFSVYAYVTSNMYDITGVYLINGDDTLICQLDGPATGGNFTFYCNPATYLPNGTERILAYNEGNNQQVKPVGTFNSPNPIYRQGYPDYQASNPGWWYWDADTNSSSLPPRDAFDDLIMEIWGTYPDWYLKWHLPSPTNVKWMLLTDFPMPSKDYISKLPLASSPSSIRVSSDSGCWWENDSIAFITEEGRYGYVAWYNIGYGWSHFRVYSLYNGLGS